MKEIVQAVSALIFLFINFIIGVAPSCVDVNIICSLGGQSGVSSGTTWSIKQADNVVITRVVQNENISICLPYGNFTMVGIDPTGSSWNGVSVLIIGVDNTPYLYFDKIFWLRPDLQKTLFFVGVDCFSLAVFWNPPLSQQVISIAYQIYTKDDLDTCINSNQADCTRISMGFGGEVKSLCLPLGQYVLAGIANSLPLAGWGEVSINIKGASNTIFYIEEWGGPQPGNAYEFKPFSITKAQCPIGSYGTLTCNKCSAGKFGVQKGQNSEATACPYNITNCPTGHFCDGLNNTATQCPAGTFNNITGQTSALGCVTCPNGYVALSKGSTTCSPCSKGAYCPNATAEILCPVGEYNNLTMQHSCRKCFAGRISLQLGSWQCFTCPIGAYCPNSTTKLLCPYGMTGSTTLSSCRIHCNEHCQFCSNIDIDTCYECRHNMYLYNGTCVNECPAVRRPTARCCVWALTDLFCGWRGCGLRRRNR